MFVALYDITLAPQQAADSATLLPRLQAAMATLPDIRQYWLNQTLPALTANAGQLVARLVFDSERAAQLAEASREWREGIAPLCAGCLVNRVGYYSTRKALRGSGAGIWRALLVRVVPNVPRDSVRAFEADLLLMPDYVGSIRSWGLGEVSSHSGPKAFTHVWEQEFDSAEGFTGEYMHHPVHWGIVDSWFDAETENYIVDPLMAQLVAPIDGPVIS